MCVQRVDKLCSVRVYVYSYHIEWHTDHRQIGQIWRQMIRVRHNCGHGDDHQHTTATPLAFSAVLLQSRHVVNRFRPPPHFTGDARHVIMRPLISICVLRNRRAEWHPFIHLLSHHFCADLFTISVHLGNRWLPTIMQFFCPRPVLFRTLFISAASNL